MGVEKKVRRGRGRGEGDDEPKFALVFRRSGEGVGGDKTDAIVVNEKGSERVVKLLEVETGE